MKAKPIIVIVLTLVIGFILGMLTSAQIRYHKLKPVSVFFSEERFRDGFYRAIQPDDQQKAKIDLILDKYARINSDLQSNFRNELNASMDDFRKELDSNLTKEQLARLKDMDDRRQQMTRQNRYEHPGDTTANRKWRGHGREGRPYPDSPDPHSMTGPDTNRLPDNK
jgi:hypothetical protein